MADSMPTYVDIQLLCRELRISAATVDRWIAAGRLPRPKPGSSSRKRLWAWREVQAAIDGRAKPAPVSRDIGQEIEDAARAATQKAHR